jgi:hypothetical protein
MLCCSSWATKSITEFAVYKPWFDTAARALGRRATAVRTSGRDLSLEEAWAYALEELDAGQSEDQGRAPSLLLARRPSSRRT